LGRTDRYALADFGGTPLGDGYEMRITPPSNSILGNLVREKLHQHLRRLLKKVWKDYLKSFRRCRAKFSKDSVHRLRVESRRLLALLNLLETLVGPAPVAQPRRLMKKNLRCLGSLRDTQVQLLEVGNKLKSFPGAKAFPPGTRPA
jgi:hypothetical protein